MIRTAAVASDVHYRPAKGDDVSLDEWNDDGVGVGVQRSSNANGASRAQIRQLRNLSLAILTALILVLLLLFYHLVQTTTPSSQRPAVVNNYFSASDSRRHQASGSDSGAEDADGSELDHSTLSTSRRESVMNSSLARCVSLEADSFSFLSQAEKVNSDKVLNHRYDMMYSHYFASLQCRAAASGRRLRFMEIGLGCGYGNEGSSVLLWSKFFPDADIHFIEYGDCIKRLQDKFPNYHFYQGDQGNAEQLRAILAQVRAQSDVASEGFSDGIEQGAIRPFDFIIDDGGHSDKQQTVSLEILIDAVKFGGVYILEDLHCSFDPPTGKEVRRCSDGVRDGLRPTIQMIHKYVDMLQESETNDPILPDGYYYSNRWFLRTIRSINCAASLCVFERFSPAEVKRKRPFFSPV